ncbi:MAG: hypothetical protein AB7Y74_09025 [Syntrophorhabdus sp.]|jgi:hypothetical protein
MNISYFFSSPDGDVPVDSETLARPFMIEPMRNHPFMALGDFFHVIRLFLLDRAGPVLTSLLSRTWDRDISLQDIDNVIIRYEKYGTLYQIVSAEIISGNQKMKLAVSAALTPDAQQNITLEYNLISYMNTKTGLPYLPRVFCINSLDVEKDSHTETVALTLAEWFEGYHEWHFSKNDIGNNAIVIWDTARGNRSVSDQEAYTIIKEASKILTFYYNVGGSERIVPWHHGAGDFIVNTDSGKVDVKLITVRGYEPFASPDTNQTVGPLLGILFFLIELTVKMRMDKMEGMGETIWADSRYMNAAIQGFFHAMKIKERDHECNDISIDDFMATLKTLNKDEIASSISSYLKHNQAPDTSDYRVIQEHMGEHAADLASALQQLSP